MGKLVNRVAVSVNGTPGTGAITLGAAMAGYQDFPTGGVVDGDVVSYVIEDGNAWEVGQGTYTAASTLLTRTTVQDSSSSKAAISATSGARVFVTALATDVNNIVRWDQVSSTITPLGRAVARLNTSAAPYEAMAYNNAIVNPRHVVSQFNGNNSVASVNSYVTDGHAVLSSGIVASAQRVASPFTTRPDIAYGLTTTITTAKGTLGSGDLLYAVMQCEGLRTRRFLMGTANARDIYIGFMANFPAGNYYVSMRNSANNRSIVKKFVIATSGVDTFVPLIFPGDTAGTWAKDTSIGITLAITFAAGTAATTATVGSYTATGAICGADQTNGAATANATFTYSDVIMLDQPPGVVTDATQVVPVDRLPSFQRHDQDELVTCQRYYETGVGQVGGYTSNVSTGYRQNFHTVKRVTPNVVTYIYAATSGNINAYSPATTPDGIDIYCSGATAGSAYGYYITISWAVDARL